MNVENIITAVPRKRYYYYRKSFDWN